MRSWMSNKIMSSQTPIQHTQTQTQNIHPHLFWGIKTLKTMSILHTLTTSELNVIKCLWRGESGVLWDCSFGRVALGPLAYLQSIARPFGQPRVVFTIDRACDPSHQALIIFAGRYQSVQKIYLPMKQTLYHYMTYFNQIFYLFHTQKKI